MIEREDIAISKNGKESLGVGKDDISYTDAIATIAERNPSFIDPRTLSVDDPKRQVLALIGHGHLDPVWLWDSTRGKARMLHTAKSALTLMDQYDDFVYTQSSPAFLQVIESVDTKLHQEIAERAQEGRWDAVGGGWVEPDMNLPLAGSLLDSMRHGQEYYKNHLGITPPTVALAADAFGHPQLQRVLRAAGYESYFHMRPQRGELWLPNGLYEWRDREGVSIFAERIFEEYGSGVNTTEGHIRASAAELRSPNDTMTVWYGVVNHGGGPTGEIYKGIKVLQDEPELPQLIFASTKEYVDLALSMRSVFPQHTGELQYHARGGYSLGIHGNNESRRVENEKDRTRRFSVMANWAIGKPYPLKEIDEAEKLALENDFHDVRQRTIIKEAEQAVDDTHAHAADIFRRTTDIAMLSLTQEVQVPVEEDTENYVIVNPHPYPVNEFVSVEEYDLKEGIAITDDTGQELPHQVIKAYGTTFTGPVPRKRIASMISVEAGGYKRISLHHNQPRQSQFENEFTTTPEVLENAYRRLSIDPRSGAVIELLDKSLGYDFIYKDAAGKKHAAFVPVICDDTMYGKPVDTWGHKKDHWTPRSRIASEQDEADDVYQPYESFSLDNITVLESGPVRSKVRVTSTYRDPERQDSDGHSTLQIDYSLLADSGDVQMDVVIDWHEKHKMLKLLIPLGLESRQTSAEGVYQPEVRNHTGEEWPTHSYLDLSGRRRDKHAYAGFSVVNQGTPSYSVENRNLMLTIVRSPDVATHDPAENDATRPHQHTDQGMNRLRFAFRTHDQDLNEQSVIRFAETFAKKPFVELQTYNPDGKLLPSGSFYALDAESIHIDSMRIVDERTGEVEVVMYETNGQNARGLFTFFGHEIPLALTPRELQILRITKDGLVSKIADQSQSSEITETDEQVETEMVEYITLHEEASRLSSLHRNRDEVKYATNVLFLASRPEVRRELGADEMYPGELRPRTIGSG